MKEIRSILRSYRNLDFSVNKAALAMVVRTEGSSYRRMGARMLVLDDGTFVGGISGGCLEGDARRRALKAIASHKPSIVTYDTTKDDEQQIGVGLGCNGVIDVLFIPLTGRDDSVSLLKEVEFTRSPKVIITIIESSDNSKIGHSYLHHVHHDQQEDPSLAEKISEALGNRRSLTYQHETERYFIEVILPSVHLHIYGSNYDVYPVTRIAEELGWDISLVGKAEKINKTIARSTKIYSQYLESRPSSDAYTAAILMSHDLATDRKNLMSLVNSDIPYIALLGPAKRKEKLFQGIVLTEQMQDRLFGPAGLDIGANTPEEIAIAICAEIISHFSHRAGGSLRTRSGPIHENQS